MRPIDVWTEVGCHIAHTIKQDHAKTVDYTSYRSIDKNILMFVYSVY